MAHSLYDVGLFKYYVILFGRDVDADANSEITQDSNGTGVMEQKYMMKWTEENDS